MHRMCVATSRTYVDAAVINRIRIHLQVAVVTVHFLSRRTLILKLLSCVGREIFYH
jgi:hypothetical protein